MLILSIVLIQPVILIILFLFLTGKSYFRWAQFQNEFDVVFGEYIYGSKSNDMPRK